MEKVEPVLEKAMTDEYGNEKRGLEGKHDTPHSCSQGSEQAMLV